MATIDTQWETVKGLLLTVNEEQKTFRLTYSSDNSRLLGDKASEGGDPDKTVWELACEEIAALDREQNLPNRNTILHRGKLLEIVERLKVLRATQKLLADLGDGKYGMFVESLNIKPESGTIWDEYPVPDEGWQPPDGLTSEDPLERISALLKVVIVAQREVVNLFSTPASAAILRAALPTLEEQHNPEMRRRVETLFAPPQHKARSGSDGTPGRPRRRTWLSRWKR